MDNPTPNTQVFFTPIADRLLRVAGGVIVVGVLYLVCTAYFLTASETTDIGYTPRQPILYSHQLHVAQMGMDCTYCHNTVDQGAFASVPPVQTCYSCHSKANGVVVQNPAKLDLLHEAWQTGQPVRWNKVHDLPDYVYFNHAAHVNRGVGCQECHGRVDQMGERGVTQVASLSMSWCLECHRNPENYLRDREKVTDMLYRDGPDGIKLGSKEQLEAGLKLVKEYHIRDRGFMTDCSTCHR